MTTAKNEVFIGLWHENCYLVAGDKNLVGESVLGGFYWWGNEKIFWLEKTVKSYIYINVTSRVF